VITCVSRPHAAPCRVSSQHVGSCALVLRSAGPGPGPARCTVPNLLTTRGLLSSGQQAKAQAPHAALCRVSSQHVGSCPPVSRPRPHTLHCAASLHNTRALVLRSAGPGPGPTRCPVPRLLTSRGLLCSCPSFSRPRPRPRPRTLLSAESPRNMRAPVPLCSGQQAQAPHAGLTFRSAHWRETEVESVAVEERSPGESDRQCTLEVSVCGLCSPSQASVNDRGRCNG
jgi:hypothetical protein